MSKKILCFILFVNCLKFYECYEPLNLKLPADYEVPTETFTLCDLNQEYLRSYCLNKGICYTLINNKNKQPKTKVKDRYKFNSNSIISDIFCSCTNEFTGTRCDVPILNQTNVPVYKIDVKEYGQQLPQPRQCSPNYECLNGGTCVYDILSGPKCLCKSGFFGENCNQFEYCAGVRDCRLRCDFGYKRDANGCETCACNCVNEENYFDEVKNAFKVSMMNESGQFCKKLCKLGYVKDQFNCFRCECVEDVMEMENSRINSLTIAPPVFPTIEDYCSTMKCSSNETCRYFDRNFYSCPEEMVNCKLIERLSKIPVCVSNSYPEPCTESLKIGNCDKFAERYYFDVIDKRCKKFFFSGCLGNRNNFISYQQCSAVCDISISNDDTSNQYPWQTNRTNSIVHSLKLLFNTTKPMSPIHTPPTPTIQTATSATTTSKPTPLLHQVATNANMAFKTISIPNISFNQVDYYLNKTNANINTTSSIQMDSANACRWVCGLNCPYGYKLDQRTKCYKCECIELNMTECGVPCFLEGTKSCLYSMRANSRPKCLCSPEYDGVYCQTYLQYFNFSVRIEKSFKLNSVITSEIKGNLSKTIANELDVSSTLIIVNELKNNLKDNSLIIRFSLHAPDFSNAASFFLLVENLHNLIDKKNLTVEIFDQQFVLHPNCEKSEELFSMDINERYLMRPNQLRSIIKHLKDELEKGYKLPPQTISLVKIKIEPTLQLEYLVKNNINDPEFCKKAYNLQNDIRTRFFTVEKFIPKYGDLASSMNEFSIGETKKLFNNEDEENGAGDSSDDTETKKLNNNNNNVFISSRNTNLNTKKTNRNKQPAVASAASIRNHRIVFISVIVSSLLLLVFLVSLVIIMQLKLNQAKGSQTLEKMEESSICKESPKTPEIPKEKRSLNDMPGYFMPNYSTIPRDFSAVELPLNATLKKVNNIVTY